MKKMLVVYYSWSNGNTKRIAEQLTNGTGADIARIETTEPYSGSHEDVIPFMTNGGWPGHVIKDMEENCKGAAFAHEMQIQFDSKGKDHLETSEEVITEWIGQINTDINK